MDNSIAAGRQFLRPQLALLLQLSGGGQIRFPCRNFTHALVVEQLLAAGLKDLARSRQGRVVDQRAVVRIEVALVVQEADVREILLVHNLLDGMRNPLARSAPNSV